MNARLGKLLGLVQNLFRRDGYLTGVDVGTRAFKVVQLKRLRRGFQLVYAGLLEFKGPVDDPDLSARVVAVQSFLKNKPIKNPEVATSVSDRSMTVRYLSLPMMPEEELKGAVQWEAKKLISSPIGTVAMDYLSLGVKEDAQGKKNELLLVAVDKTLVIERVSFLQKVGMTVSVVDISPLVLMNLVRLNHAEILDQNIVYVDLGASHTEISIAKRGGLRFTRNVTVGMEQISQAIEKIAAVSTDEAEKWKRRYGLEITRMAPPLQGEENIPKADALMEAIRGLLDNIVLEIQRSIDFYHVQFRGEQIRKVVLTGGGSLMPGLQPYIASYFDVEILMDNPLGHIHYDPRAFNGLTEMAPRFATAVGLALRPSLA